MRSASPVVLFWVVLAIGSHAAASESDEYWFKEYQLQGELVAAPIMLPGFGVLVASDDRKLWLIDPSQDKRTNWVMPRRPIQLSASTSGLALVQLSDGRASLVNLKGRVIRVQARLDDPMGTWMLAGNGRLYFLSLAGKLSALSPRGSPIGSKDLPLRFSRIYSTNHEEFLVDFSTGESGVVRLDGSFQVLNSSQGQSDLKVESRPGTYLIDLNQSEEHFVYDAKAALNYYRYEPQLGLLAWGDSRWKLFIKKTKAQALQPLVPPSRQGNQANRAVMIRELQFLLENNRSSSKDLFDFFKSSMGDLQNLDLVHGILVEVLSGQGAIKTPQAMHPANRAVLTRIGQDLFTIQDSSWMAREILARPETSWETMDLAGSLAMDIRGDILLALASLATRRLANTDFVQGAREVLRRSASSYPEELLPVYFRLRAQLGDF